MKILLFFVALIYIPSSIQWREFKTFDCYRIKEKLEDVLNRSSVFPVEKCHVADESMLHTACKTNIVDGVVYSGCVNRANWKTNFLCSPLHTRREYKERLDSSGLFVFDEVKSGCCREPLCNNAHYFKIMKNKQQGKEHNIDHQIISDALLIIFCFIMGTIFIIGELLNRKPMLGRIEGTTYTKRTNTEKID